MNRYFMCETSHFGEVEILQIPVWVAGKKVGDVVTEYVPANPTIVATLSLNPSKTVKVYDVYSVSPPTPENVDWKLVILETKDQTFKVTSIVR